MFGDRVGRCPTNPVNISSRIDAALADEVADPLGQKLHYFPPETKISSSESCRPGAGTRNPLSENVDNFTQTV